MIISLLYCSALSCIEPHWTALNCSSKSPLERRRDTLSRVYILYSIFYSHGNEGKPRQARESYSWSWSALSVRCHNNANSDGIQSPFNTHAKLIIQLHSEQFNSIDSELNCFPVGAMAAIAAIPNSIRSISLFHSIAAICFQFASWEIINNKMAI